jgi:hypothetical protein
MCYKLSLKISVYDTINGYFIPFHNKNVKYPFLIQLTGY